MAAEIMINGVNNWQVRSGGTEESERIKVTESQIGWTDVSIAMEEKLWRRMSSQRLS
ncbi:hypothetical protein [Paenibacillus sp. 1P03SA]|uniref:hypothetical protein n=1 Tax=Paenibacillus sp. 1P03SA TaxID=3132294 RepID=UPI0039A07E0B